MNYYLFNMQESLQKAKDRYHYGGGKEKAAKYHIENKEVLRENAKNKYRNLSEEEKEAKMEYGRNRYTSITKYEKNKLKKCQRKYQAAKK